MSAEHSQGDISRLSGVWEPYNPFHALKLSTLMPWRTNIKPPIRGISYFSLVLHGIRGLAWHNPEAISSLSMKLSTNESAVMKELNQSEQSLDMSRPRRSRQSTGLFTLLRLVRSTPGSGRATSPTCTTRWSPTTPRLTSIRAEIWVLRTRTPQAQFSSERRETRRGNPVTRQVGGIRIRNISWKWSEIFHKNH